MFDLLKTVGGILDEVSKTTQDNQPKQPEPKMAAKGDPVVFELQKKLISRGAKITADGIMGPATKQAQKDFPDPVEQKSTVVSKSDSLVSQDQISKLFPKHKDLSGLTAALNAVLPKYQINTPQRIAGFLAQCGHESAGFSVLTENLNYSADGLCKVWPKRFPSAAVAQPYHRNPEKIANKVYCDRDRKSTRLNSSHIPLSRMPSSA